MRRADGATGTDGSAHFSGVQCWRPDHDAEWASLVTLAVIFPQCRGPVRGYWDPSSAVSTDAQRALALVRHGRKARGLPRSDRAVFAPGTAELEPPKAATPSVHHMRECKQ